MTRLAAAVLIMCLALPGARAQSLPSLVVDMFTPTLWSVGITLARWMMKEERKVFYVEVTAQGRDFKEAQDQAMRMAVERAVGAVVSSAGTTVGGQLTKDEIIVYSAGYVDNHEVVEHQTVGNLYQIRMRIWVSHSKLANRLLGESRADASIEGGRISTQIQSFQKERAAGDAVLMSVLQDFPARSFRVTVGRTRVLVDDQRRSWLQVPFVLAWDQNYVTSLAEAIRVINQRSDCDSWLSQCQNRVAAQISVGKTRGWFDDTVAHDNMHREMVIRRPQVRLKLLDSRGQQRFVQCYSLSELDHSNYTNWNFVSVGGMQIVVNADRVKNANINLEIGNLPVQSLDSAEIDIVRFDDCPNVRR